MADLVTRPLLFHPHSQKSSLVSRRCNLSNIFVINIQGAPKNWGHRPMTIFLSNLNRFKNIFTERFHSKFVVKWILKIPPHLACVASLPCETLLSAKQAINDKLRFGGVVNNQIKKGLLLSL